jgi:hypothetical protein
MKFLSKPNWELIAHAVITIAVFIGMTITIVSMLMYTFG